MTWLFILLAMAVIALVTGVVTGRIVGSMEPPASSLPFRGLPPEDVVPADLEELRFDAALRGYRMDEVDAVIDRLAVELQRRDDEIAELRAALASYGVDGGASDQYSSTPAVPGWPPERDDGAGNRPAYVPQAGDDEPRGLAGPRFGLSVARITVGLDVAAPPERVWSLLVDWPAHGRWVPLTTVRVLTPSGAGVGARFVGRTSVGPLGFDDPMEITYWEPPEAGRPGRCQVVKQGRVVLGSAEPQVRGLPGGGSRVEWAEDVQVAPVAVTRVLRPLVSLAGRFMFTRMLRQMAAEASG